MAKPIKSFDKILSTGITITIDENSIEDTYQAVANVPIIDAYKSISDLIDPMLSPHRQHPELKLVTVNYPDQDIRVPNVQNVRLRYSNRLQLANGVVTNGTDFALEPNPLKEPAYIDCGFWTTTKDWELDLDSLPFCTTAGEEILHSEEVEYQMWVIEAKVPKYPPVFGSPKNGSRIFINKDKVKFAGEKWDENTLMIKQITMGKMDQKNGYFFFPLRFMMIFNPDTWLVKKRNAGFIAKEPILVTDSSVAFLRKYILKPAPIKIGDPPQYPSRPIPIQNKPGKNDFARDPLNVDGMVFPEFVTKSPAGMPTGYSDQALLDPKRLKEIWKETVLTFRTREAIKFTGNIPLS